MDISLVVGIPSEVNLSPANKYEEILQNVRTILATPVGSVPLDRDFGVDMRFIDRPLPKAQAEISSGIVNAIRTYEPRVSVKAITWTADTDGILRPKVTVRINDTE